MIAPELVLTVPMASRTGFVAYLNYTAGSNKGDVSRGRMFNSVWQLGEMDEARQNYTGSAVVEPFTGDGSTKAFTLMWTPVVGSVEVRVGGAVVPATDYTVSTEHEKRFEPNGPSVLTVPIEGSANSQDKHTVVTFTNAPADQAAIRIGYKYDNIVIPQDDLPLLNVDMAEVTLTAHARRIAVYYSQIANFQAKTDYGFDLGDNLAKQAIGELQYEIDSEIIDGLHKAVDTALIEKHQWSKTPGVGVSLVEHYQGFAKLFDETATDVYNATLKFTPNYMVCARDVVTVLSFLNGWQAAPLGQINGPYLAGTFNGVKVFVSPMLHNGEFFVGVNGSDMMTSAAVYGVYMPIIPTALLGYADGGMSQGYSTMYDFQILSKKTVRAGQADEQVVSPLLSGGRIID